VRESRTSGSSSRVESGAHPLEDWRRFPTQVEEGVGRCRPPPSTDQVPRLSLSPPSADTPSDYRVVVEPAGIVNAPVSAAGRHGTARNGTERTETPERPIFYGSLYGLRQTPM